MAIDPQAKAIGDRLRAEINRAKQELILAVDANLRAAPSEGGTPVDTGHARANWVPGVGAPAGSEVSGDAAHAAGVLAIVRSELGDDLVQWNAAPYINRLNLGSSTHAPAGFIEAAVDRGVAEVQQHYAGLQIDVTTGGAVASVTIRARADGGT